MPTGAARRLVVCDRRQESLEMPLEPAQLEFTDDGTPRSARFNDVYHTRAGGLEQARFVFVGGNELPDRWMHRPRFTIVETGFGIGLNFLVTWSAWRNAPGQCERLHFVSAELHPFRRDDLAKLHARWPELAALSDELLAHWPTLTPGIHRLHLDGGRVVLTLMFGDAGTLLPQLMCRADAFFLDGFSPAHNPELWTSELLHQIARLAAPGATLATWSVCGDVRRTLTQAGFECSKVRGYRAKREMLKGRFHAPQIAPRNTERRAIVVGAGLAGSSMAHRLAERGWQVEVIETEAHPGLGASGNLTGVLRPLPSLDDNRLARITRAGALYGLAHLRRLAESGLPVRWNACGVLHLAREPGHEAKQKRVVETHQPPSDYLRYVDREEASTIAGWPLTTGGWWFPGGAWVNPPSQCTANLAAFPDRILCLFNRKLDRLVQDEQGWSAVDKEGKIIATAPVVILANGVGIRDVVEARTLPVRSARGQVTHLPAAEGSAPKVVVCRLGYVSPVLDGIRCAGATFSVDDHDEQLRAAEHADNLAKLNFMLPGHPTPDNVTDLAGRVGFRPASPDRLPMVGAIPCIHRAERGTALGDIPRHPGLHALSGFGARGLVWASLAAELLASQIDGDPLPLERELVEALDPARFLLRPAPKFFARRLNPTKGRRTATIPPRPGS